MTTRGRGPLQRALVVAVLPALAALALAGALAATAGTRLADLLPDTAAVADVPPHTGAISTLGLMLWAAAAAVALVAAPRVGGPRGTALRALGLLGVLLAVDDAFLLHDEVLPGAGVPQPVVLVVLGATALAVLARVRPALRGRADTGVLLLAVALLAASAGIDLVQDALPLSWGAERLLLEDGCKLLGIAVWLRYLLVLSRDEA